MDPSEARTLFRHFAKMLGYPNSRTFEDAFECERLLETCVPEAAPLVQRFVDFLSESSQGRVEEVYTSMFDMNVTHAPYLGYHLFGETYKRSSFMISLREQYADAGFSYDGVEMPDHITVLLDFLAAQRDEKVERSLIQDSLLPALNKMADAKPLNGSAYTRRTGPYKDVEMALLLVLRRLSDSWSVMKMGSPGGVQL